MIDIACLIGKYRLINKKNKFQNIEKIDAE
jgi:hypothetical protein